MLIKTRLILFFRLTGVIARETDKDTFQKMHIVSTRARCKVSMSRAQKNIHVRLVD